MQHIAFDSALNFLYLLISLITSAAAVWQGLVAKKYKQSTRDGIKTIATMASVIEAFPVDSMTKDQLKDRIAAAAKRLGIEEDILAPIVADISEIIRKQPDEQPAASTAEKAVIEYTKSKPIKPVVPMLLFVLFTTAALTGCVSTQKSRDQRTRVENNAKEDAKNLVEETTAVNKELLEIKANREFSKRLNAYNQGMANAKKLRDAELSASVTTAYLLGMSETRRELDAEVVRLALIPAKGRALGNAIIVTNQMADDEINVNQANMKDLLDPAMFEALVGVLDAVQKKYTPAEVLVDPQTGKPRDNGIAGATAVELLNSAVGVDDKASGHHSEHPTHVPAHHKPQHKPLPHGHVDTNN